MTAAQTLALFAAISYLLQRNGVPVMGKMTRMVQPVHRSGGIVAANRGNKGSSSAAREPPTADGAAMGDESAGSAAAAWGTTTCATFGQISRLATCDGFALLRTR